MDLVKLARKFVERKAALSVPADFTVVSVTMATKEALRDWKEQGGRMSADHMNMWLSKEKAESNTVPVIIKAEPRPVGTLSAFKNATVDERLHLTLQQMTAWFNVANCCRLDCLLLKRYLDSLLGKRLRVNLKGSGVCQVVSIAFQPVQAVLALNPALAFTQRKRCYAEDTPFYASSPMGSNHVVLKLTLNDHAGREKSMYIDPTYLQVNPWSGEKVKFMAELPAANYPTMCWWPDAVLASMEKGREGIDALLGLNANLTSLRCHPSCVPEFQAYGDELYKMMLTAIVQGAKEPATRHEE